MQYFSITNYGDSNFNLKYNDAELLGIIKDYIKKKIETGEDYFTYFTLCKTVLEKVRFEDKVKEKRIIFEYNLNTFLY